MLKPTKGDYMKAYHGKESLKQEVLAELKAHAARAAASAAAYVYTAAADADARAAAYIIFSDKLIELIKEI